MSAPDPDAAKAPEAGGTASVAEGEILPRRSFGQAVKDAALFFASPFVTLAYLALFPFIGIATLRQALRRGKSAG